MINIKVAREFIADIHSIYPKGLRPTVRKNLTKAINTPSVISNFKDEYDIFGELQFNLNRNNNKQRLKSENFNLLKYLTKIVAKENQQLFTKTLKQMNVIVCNKTDNKLENNTKISLLQGLATAKSSGLKLPNTISIELNPNKNINGEYKEDFPHTIFLYTNKNNNALGKTTIHEIVHMNDKHNWFYNLISLIITKLLYKNLIAKEIREYATSDRDEFIACTAAKILSEGKNWSDLHPLIQKLYKFMGGPEIKTIKKAA